MAEKLDPKKIVTFEELLMSNMYTQEAFVNILEKKGILSKKELLERMFQKQNERNQLILKAFINIF